MHLVIVGGSDAGISAGLRARQLDPTAEVTLVVADSYPNYSICGIPYYISGEVADWRNLAHRTRADLDAAGLQLRLDTRAVHIDPAARLLTLATPDRGSAVLDYDALVVGTGAVPVRPPIAGLTGPDALGPTDGVHLLHSMGDTLTLDGDLQERRPRTALVVGAGYNGLEMAEALTARRGTPCRSPPRRGPTSTRSCRRTDRCAGHAAGTSSASRARTRASMSSRIGRTASTP